jgi:hypothetical protein
MNAWLRIESILKAHILGKSVTGVAPFYMTNLGLIDRFDELLPNNLRLGHLAEKAVSSAIGKSKVYRVVAENIQIVESKSTVGELDFLLEEIVEMEFVHMELAYKFYLYDSTISTTTINNWIGPNRKDSLVEKLEKLKSKQFPLIQHACAKSILNNLNIQNVSQALCFMVGLYVPVGLNECLDSDFLPGVRGYYMNIDAFKLAHNETCTYYLPNKKEWGMDASSNQNWLSFTETIEQVELNINEKRSVLCWQKNANVYKEFFITWW